MFNFVSGKLGVVVALSNVVSTKVVDVVKNEYVGNKGAYYAGKVSQIAYIAECDKQVVGNKAKRDAKEVDTKKDMDAYAQFMASRK